MFGGSGRKRIGNYWKLIELLSNKIVIKKLLLQLSWDFDKKFPDKDAIFNANWPCIRSAVINQLQYCELKDPQDGAYYLYLKDASSNGIYM